MQSKQGHGPAAALLLAACLPMTSATTSLASDMRYGASRWAQIGDSPHHQFCGKARSPLENIFAELPAPPRLIIFNFLGLSTFHWLAEGKLRRDLQRLDRQLPKETACLFLTTIPTYRASINRPRWRAQANLEAALKETGSRCRFVAGHTRTTLAAFENNRAYYRKQSNGGVRDP